MPAGCDLAALRLDHAGVAVDFFAGPFKQIQTVPGRGSIRKAAVLNKLFALFERPYGNAVDHRIAGCGYCDPFVRALAYDLDRELLPPAVCRRLQVKTANADFHAVVRRGVPYPGGYVIRNLLLQLNFSRYRLGLFADMLQRVTAFVYPDAGYGETFVQRPPAERLAVRRLCGRQHRNQRRKTHYARKDKRQTLFHSTVLHSLNILHSNFIVEFLKNVF